MKQKYLIIIFIFFLFILTACSSETSVELIETKVEIIKDKEKTGAIEILDGDFKGQEFVPTVLHYEFTIKNIGNKKIDNIESENLIITIQPHDSLIAVSEKILGINIYNSSHYKNTGLGFGTSYATSLEPDQEETFAVYFDLGISEKTSEVSLLVPSRDELKELIEHALEATLVIELDEEEIARFDINP
ncbi:hypothetical protein SPD48_08570 [Pseudogracilibacillus sp. SE30717A]|uniref:hypothetical protein n=1 Tax=Pseudogracilibacillus sp. SE30717A TaxID=3098293 RepID=UPI00300DFDFD